MSNLQYLHAHTIFYSMIGQYWLLLVRPCLINYGALVIKGFRKEGEGVEIVFKLQHSAHLCPIFVFIGNHWIAQEIPRGGGNVLTGK